MRYALCAGGIFVIASTFFAPDAQAQISYTGEGECNKGIFWPFVRDPGDCLTDAERRSGMSGTHRGSEVPQAETAEPASQSNAPDPSPAQAQQSAPPSEGNAPPANPSLTPNVASPAVSSPPTAPPNAQMPAPASVPTPAQASVPAPAEEPEQAASAQPVAAQNVQPASEAAAVQDPASDGRATYTGDGGCTKGVFWPFVRRAGDCLTDAEIRNGQSGTYQ
jgi:hypothetical protein